MSKELFILLYCSFLTCTVHVAALAEDTKSNQILKNWIAQKYSTADCQFPDSTSETVYLNDVQYFDFDHDGKKELIVTASTCWTGTAGPDVHIVLIPKGKKEFIELAIPEPNKEIGAVVD